VCSFEPEKLGTGIELVKTMRTLAMGQAFGKEESGKMVAFF
jgi:hypothetical protein